jgi:hypothetical protein
MLAPLNQRLQHLRMNDGLMYSYRGLSGETYEQDELNPSRMARASPLRWGKREAPDWGIEDEAEKRAPLRWGKRMSDILSELQKRKEQTLLRWGKRAAIRGWTDTASRPGHVQIL